MQLILSFYSEETLWETQKCDDSDESSERSVRGSMSNREEPDGLDASMALDFPTKVKELISFGVKYEPQAKRAAIKLCQLL